MVSYHGIPHSQHRDNMSRLVSKIGDIAEIDKELNAKPDFSRIQSEFTTMMVAIRGSQRRFKSVILGRSRVLYSLSALQEPRRHGKDARATH